MSEQQQEQQQQGYQQQQQQQQQREQKQNVDGSNGNESYQHNSLLNPLPSYIGRSISTQSSEHSADDSLPVFFFLIFDPDDCVLLGSQQHPSACPPHPSACCHHSHTKRHALLPLSRSPRSRNRPRSLSHRRGRSVCLGRRIQGAARPRLLCSCIRVSAQRRALNWLHKQILSFSKMMVMSVACGGSHSACLSTSNDVYTWGCGTYGQLGQGIDVESSFEPLLLHKLSGKEICAVGKGKAFNAGGLRTEPFAVSLDERIGVRMWKWILRPIGSG